MFEASAITRSSSHSLLLFSFGAAFACKVFRYCPIVVALITLIRVNSFFVDTLGVTR